MEASPDGILIVDADHRIIAHNRRFADMWQIAPAMFAGGDDNAVLAQAIRFAHFDALTGLANRAAFADALAQAVVRTRRGPMGFAVLYLDLDHFKDVNDTLGHPIGDARLVAVAEPAHAALLAAKLIEAIATPFSIEGHSIYTGASIGIDIYGPGSPDAETLLSHADVALYGAKREGRGGYRFFTEAMDREVRLRVALGTELRHGIDAGELFLLYQPQVVLQTGQITGVEALVRWRHPQRGILGPDLFIPVAESIGLITRLGHWVLWTACEQGRAWVDAGVPPIRIGVNISAGQFRTSTAMEEDIMAALAQTRLPPHLLELELTESVLMDASRDHADLLQRLHRLGVLVAIDDFGTGYSSLDYLRRFPSNRIKIAQIFVRDIETTPGNAAIVKATISLARELGIMVIAEGVERQAQADLLRDWGCTDIQGYYFARPLAPDAIGRLMHEGGIITPQAAPPAATAPAP